MEKVNEYFYIKKEEKNYCRCRAVFEGNAEYKNAYEFSKKLIEYFYITCQRMCDYDAEGEAELRSRFNVLPYSYEANIKAEDAGEGFCSLSVKYSLCARFPGGKSFCESECILFDEKRNLIISPAALCRILLGKNAKKIKFHLFFRFFAKSYKILQKS